MNEGIEEVEPRAGQAMLDGGATLLDVRHPEEWDAGHAPGAVLIPLNQLGDRHTELPSGRSIVVICRSGARSARATEALVGAGYEAVNLAGGMRAWVAEGLPCVTDAGDPGIVA
jgi:rhodanese-related sulfurtransferase